MFAIRIAFEAIDEINYLKMHFVLIALFDIKVKSLNVTRRNKNYANLQT